MTAHIVGFWPTHWSIISLIEVYAEMVAANIPTFITDGLGIWWHRNRKLGSYDTDDIDGGLEYNYWNSPKHLPCLDCLAKKGFCIW